MTTWFSPELDVSSGSLAIRVWSMSVCAVGSRSRRSPAWPTTSTAVAAPASAKRQIQGDRHAGAYLDIALQGLKSLGLDGDVIRIRWQIAEDVTARRVRVRGPRKSADRIADPYLNGLHHTARRILHCALHRAGAAKPLREGRRRHDGQDQHGDHNP